MTSQHQHQSRSAQKVDNRLNIKLQRTIDELIRVSELTGRLSNQLDNISKGNDHYANVILETKFAHRKHLAHLTHQIQQISVEITVAESNAKPAHPECGICYHPYSDRLATFDLCGHSCCLECCKRLELDPLGDIDVEHEHGERVWGLIDDGLRIYRCHKCRNIGTVSNVYL